MKTEIGLGIQSDKSGADYASIAARAEECGIDVLTVFSDLMFQPPLFALLEMARATKKVRLGPACLNPYSMAPYEIAGQIATLDLASQGRAYLGLAKGTWLAAVGLEQPKPVVMIRECWEVVSRLLSKNTDGFSGQYFSLAPSTAFYFEPFRSEVPLLIGTWGEQTAALAGRVADEVKIGGSANPGMLPIMRAMIEKGANQIKRNVDEVRICIGAVTVVDEDGERARTLARTEVAMYIAVVAELDSSANVDPDLLSRIKVLVDQGNFEAAGKLIPDDVLDLFAFSGTPEQVAAQAQLLIDAGAGRVEFGTPHGITPARGVELIGTRVLPLLNR